MATGGLNFDPRMAYRRLGKTGLMVSAIGLGGHGGKSVEERAVILRRAAELGTNYLDNATAEESDLHARALGGDRQHWIIGFSSWPERLTPDYEAELTAVGMMANIEARLTAYRTDMLDIWRPVTASWPAGGTGGTGVTGGSSAACASPPLAKGGPRGGDEGHNATELAPSAKRGIDTISPLTRRFALRASETPLPCPKVGASTEISTRALDLTVEVFEKTHQQGKVRFLGISGHNPALFRRVLRDYPQFSVLFFPYPFVARPAPSDSLLALAAEKDVGIIGIKPFAAGAAFGNKPDIWQGRLDPRAASLLKIILQEPRVSAVIPSAVLPGQLEQNAKATYTPHLPPTDADRRAFQECLATYRRGLETSFAGYQWLRDWEVV